MSAVAFVSMEQYRRSRFEPDVDYVDGVLEERNTCLVDHAMIQSALAALIRNERVGLGVQAFISPRIQVSPTRFRIPDVCVMPADWKRLAEKTPLLCLEVKSEECSLEREAARAGLSTDGGA
jgi:hypothetical protein